MDRFSVNLFSSARSFNRGANVTRSINTFAPVRGGWRL